jgi:hypothetical protein
MRVSSWSRFKLCAKASSEFCLEIKPPSEEFFLADTSRRRTALSNTRHLLTQ